MRLLSWMQPREHAHAALVVTVLLRVGALVTVAATLLQLALGQGQGAEVAVLAVMAGLLVVAQRARHWDDLHPTAWAVVPPAAVVVLIAVDLVTRDASLTAQAFLFFPALYGASELRRPGALLLLALCLVGEAVLVVSLLTWMDALTQFVYLAAAMTTTTLLLVRAREVQDQLVAQLTRQAAIDPLTGLVTRRVLDQAAQSALAGLHGGAGTGLILLDVDHFKAINDGHGHLAGDDVLVQLSRLLTDLVGRDQVVSRLGGDEIAVLLPGSSRAQTAAVGQAIIERVRVTDFVLPEGDRLAVTLSAGMAHAPTHGLDLRDLYAAADTGLYAAKRAGRDQVQPPVGAHHAPSRPDRGR